MTTARELWRGYVVVGFEGRDRARPFTVYYDGPGNICGRGFCKTRRAARTLAGHMRELGLVTRVSAAIVRLEEVRPAKRLEKRRRA